MELVELLARELKVWPEHGCVQITQDKDKNVYYWRRDGAVFDGDEWSHESGGLCDTKWFLDPMPASICTDHATAIVTRADWKAEVARLAAGKPEQPQRETEHVSCRCIIQPKAELLYYPCARGPLQWRDRIREIDITVEALEEERAALVQQLEDEGFRLIGAVNAKIAAVAQAHEDMSDWRNWKAGDLIECIDDDNEIDADKGDLLEILQVEGNPYDGDLPVETEKGWPLLSEIRWHSRPSA